jgi:putative nucleotidyltransferase with HDIG domain
MYTPEKLFEKFKDGKTLPHVAIKVTQMVNDENTTMQDFEETIQLDPILVSRLLRLVNSPYFFLSNKIDYIAQAVVYVGMKSLRNLVAVEALRDIFNDTEDSSGFSRKNLWLHSATVAILADMVGKRIFGDSREDLFLAGIIHDIGLIIEDQVAGGLLREACHLYLAGKGTFVECERQMIGTDHCEVGHRIATEWKMPQDVINAIRYHHNIEKEPAANSVTGILQLSEYMAGKMKYGVLPGKIEPLSPHLVKHVKSMMSNYKIIVRDLPQEMEKAKNLYDPQG